VADRSFAESQRQASPGNELAGRAHPDPSRPDGGTVGDRNRLARLDRACERLGRGRQGVEDRLVTRLAPTPPREPRNSVAKAGPSSTANERAWNPASMQAVP
jgi:hypothetical protein